MMEHSGLEPVEYTFKVVDYSQKKKTSATGEIPKSMPMKDLIGKKIKLEFTGEIRCENCGRVTTKSFNQGSCFKCFMSLASNDMCILRPETCHFHENTCREPEWGKANCFKKHIVYLANTSGIKVGITKENPYTKRWVDQGAVAAIPIMEVQSRLDAGLVEVEFSKFISDKTSWQKMISGDPPLIDLSLKLKELLKQVDFQKKVSNTKLFDKQKITTIQYPILHYPKKKKSLKPEPSKPIEDVLVGIKGQYLLFENGVINIRTYVGYYCKLSE
jgi:hypothetical protein